MKKGMITAFIMICTYLGADQGLSIECVDVNWSFSLLYITEEGDVVTFPDDYLQDLDLKGSSAAAAADGTYILFSGYNYDYTEAALYRIDTATGRRKKMLGDADYNYILGEVSPDTMNALFYKYDYENQVYDMCLLDIRQGTYRFITQVDYMDDYDHVFKWLGNDSVLYFTVSDASTKVFEYSLQEKSLDPVRKFPVTGWVNDVTSDGRVIFNNSDAVHRDGYFDLSDGSTHYFSVPSQFCSGYKWSQDGSMAAYLQQSGDGEDLMVLDVNSNRKTKITHFAGEYNSVIGWTGGDSRIVYSTVEDDLVSGRASIRMYDLDFMTADDLSGLYGLYVPYALACPVISLPENDSFVRFGETLIANAAAEKAGSHHTAIPEKYVIDSKLTVRIGEVLPEITRLDRVVLIAGGLELLPESCPAELSECDGNYIILRRDEYIDLGFRIPPGYCIGLVLECSGYYDPLY